MNRATKILLSVFALVVLAAGAGAGVVGYLAYEDLKKENEKLAELPPPPERVFATGLVETVGGEIDVMPQIAGELTEVLVGDGDSVKKDQLLAVIDAQRQKDALGVAEANLALAKARLRRALSAEADASHPPVHAANDASVPVGEPSEEDVEIAREAVKLAEKRLQQAQTEYEYRHVRAPQDGTVLKVHRHAGDSVQPGAHTPVVRIADTDELRIRLEVDEIELSKLETGMEGDFAIRGNSRHVGRLAIERVIPRFGWEEIDDKDTSRRVDTRAARLLCNVTAADVDLYAGQRITAEFEIDEDDAPQAGESDEPAAIAEAESDDDEDLSEDPDEPSDTPVELASLSTIPDELQEEEAAWADAVEERLGLVDRHPGEARFRDELAVAHARLGCVLVRQGKPDEAQREFDMALELDDDSRYRWYPPALVQAAVGESKQYRASCRTVLDCYEKSDDREILNQVAWACAVAPEAVDDYERVVELTDRAVAGVDQPMHHLQNTRGAVLYRAGRYEEALRQLEAAVADHWKGGTAWDWFFLAMIHHELGNGDDAQAWLDKAADWMDEAPELKLSESGEAQNGPLLDWDQQLELEILRRETEALLTIRRA